MTDEARALEVLRSLTCATVREQYWDLDADAKALAAAFAAVREECAMVVEDYPGIPYGKDNALTSKIAAAIRKGG